MDNEQILESLDSELKDLPNEFEKLAELVDLYNCELKTLESTLKQHTLRSKNELNELNQLKCFYNSTKLQTDTVEADVQKRTYEMNTLIDGLHFK
jgi:hypothetical protein